MSVLPTPVEIETITLPEARRQQPDCFPSYPHRCITHFHACDCREHKLAVLINDALDAAFLLDNLKETGLNAEQIESAKQVVERCYTACEDLGHKFPVEDEDEVTA